MSDSNDTFHARLQAIEKERDRLQERLDLLDLIFQGDQLTPYSWHVPSRKMGFDARFHVMFGGQPGEAPKSVDDWIQRAHPEDRKCLEDALAKHGSGSGALTDVEYRVRHESGAWVWVRDRGKAVAWDEAGRPARVRGALRDINARKLAEAALRESEERYRRITEAITDYIYTVRVDDGRAVETQHRPGCVAITGYSSEDLTKDPYLWYSMVLEDDRSAVKEQARRVLAGEDCEPIEHRIVRKDGSVRWVRNTSVPHFDAHGRLATYDGLIEDITERKQAEEALKDSEEKLSQILEHFKDGLVLVDSRGVVRIWNKAAEDLTGRPRPEALGRPAWEAWRDIAPPRKQHPEEERRIESMIKEILSTGQADWANQWREHDYPSPDGTLRVIEDYFFTFKAEEGFMVCAIMRDITERKRAEESLAAEKERLSVTLASIGDGVIATDIQGDVLLINRVAEGLTGWMQERALGRSIAEVLPVVDAETRRRIPDLMRNVAREVTPTACVRRVILTSGDGAERWIECASAPIRDRNEDVTGAVFVITDVTNKERLEQELIKTERLESIAILAGGIAHDFNNILTGILGNISLAKNAAASGDKIHKWLEEADRAVLHARDLTRQLLTFSKGGAPVRRPTRLQPLIEEAALFTMRGSNVGVAFSLPDDLWHAEADAGQLNQAVSNLVLNAVQAMPDGGTIRIQGRNVLLDEGNVYALSPGRYVRFDVIDQGVGIPEEHLAHVFDPYFTTKQKGSGLGLATTYSILTRHGGHVYGESRVGRGSTFTFILPASDQPIDGPAPALETPKRGQGRILVMDDEESLRRLASEMLSNRGYSVDCVRDGGEAILKVQQAQAARQPYAAAILDLTVRGGMGGREAAARIREIAPGMKIVVSSGYSSDPVLSEYRRFGFDGMLAKPYGVEAMIAEMQRVLESQD
ncbi:MAG: PAS domain S-box protein [Vicinamibacteria bacterium]|nr:PAS domain S-box protein [Vicinamibacteria bacterium]